MDEIKYGPLTLVSEDMLTLTVTACDVDATEADIPLRIDGMPVVGVAVRAFEGCRELRRVSFPEADEEAYISGLTFTEIGDNAFLDCVSLTEVELPDTLHTVGHGAFYNCRSLTRAVFSPSAFIMAYAFMGCESLREVTPLDVVMDGVFSGCASLTSLPLADGVRMISEDAFEGCDGLTEITIPSTVTCIEPLAFRGCANLTRVTFECNEGWYTGIRYNLAKRWELDLSDPEKNAHVLAFADFDDGVTAWRRDALHE